jgi:hypothetical protein
MHKIYNLKGLAGHGMRGGGGERCRVSCHVTALSSQFFSDDQLQARTDLCRWQNSVRYSRAGEGWVILRSRLAFDGFQARALPGASLADPQGGVIRGADWKGCLMRGFGSPPTPGKGTLGPQGSVHRPQPWPAGISGQHQELVTRCQIVQQQIKAGFQSS